MESDALVKGRAVAVAVSRHGTLLPVSDDTIEYIVSLWTDSFQSLYAHPRAMWLSGVESMLRAMFPQSSSADRKLTARHYAPFPLALGPDVP